MQTFTGIEYLMIDIASNFGLEKKTWDERISWFKENESQLDELIHQAEEPALFYAGLKAYQKAKVGIASGYPISLDATSSGLQILACLVGDNFAASLCNVLDTGTRADAYTIIYDSMLTQLGEAAKISRDDCKQAIMTSLYGSTAVPKEVFGEGELLTCFLETMDRMAPAVWELNQVMLDIWDPKALSHDWVMPDNYHVHIPVITNTTEKVHFMNEPFEVIRKINAPLDKGRSLGANMTHSIDGMIVREMVRRCNFHPPTVNYCKGVLESGYAGSKQAQDVKNTDGQMVKTLWEHYKKSGFLSARILEHLHNHNVGHIDEPGVIHELIESLPTKPFEVLPIHDCFRCLPNYGDDLRKQYNLQLHSLAKSNMLSYLLSQIILREIQVGKLDDSMAEKILHANYALS
jgi:DNA-dependent RNA polymerase